MTATEFKTRLANGDRLAVVMRALWENNYGQRRKLQLQGDELRKCYAEDASHILAALASAEAKRQ